MNIQHLFKYLHTDLNELTEIMSELVPGRALSEMEVKLIQSRIRTLNEDIDFLHQSLTDQKHAGNADNAEQPQQTFKQTAASSTYTEAETEPQKNKKAKDEPLENQQPEKQDTVTEAQQKSESGSDTESTDRETISTQKEKPEKADVSQPEMINQQPAKRTIADKYNGKSGSLHDKLATHIEQKDLASKLQQNPIEDLTKAIKLNDKVWFINDLFDGNAGLYNETIRTINNMTEMDDALTYLEENFSFDQEKDSFKNFIEFIYRRFLKT